MKTRRLLVLLAAAAIGCSSAQPGSRPARAAPVVRPTTTRAIDPIIARIREEGLERSQVMETLDYLCNVIGPRLTASPGQQRASEWTRDRLAEWGLSNAHLERWGPFGRGWSVERFSMRITAPNAFTPIGYPKAWSPGLDAPLSAEVVFLDVKVEEDLAEYEGTLAGKIVLIGQPRNVDARFQPLASRLSDAELEKLAAYKPGQPAVPERQPAETASERRARFAASSGNNEKLMAATQPATRRAATRAATRRASTTAATRKSSTTTTTTAPATTQSYPRGYDPLLARMISFANDEGAALIVTGSTSGDGGTVFVQQASIPGEGPRRSWGPTTRPRVWSDDAP